MRGGNRYLEELMDRGVDTARPDQCCTRAGKGRGNVKEGSQVLPYAYILNKRHRQETGTEAGEGSTQEGRAEGWR